MNTAVKCSINGVLGLFLVCWVFAGDIDAKTAITIDSLVAGSIDTGDLESEIQDIADFNGPNIANSFALANITGYPIGKATIGSFPHLQAGISLGAGFTNMRYFDKNNRASDNGSLPRIMPNPVVHLGMGLAGGMDLVGKFFVISKSIVDMPVESDLAKLTHYNILSAGGRLRYNIVKKQTLIPFIFNFGGITLSFGADAMYGELKVQGDYEAQLDNIDVSVGAFNGAIPVDFDGDYDARILWGILSATGRAVAYFDVMYLFSFFTGPGLTANIGYFKVDFNGTGAMTTNDPGYLIEEPSGNVGTMTFTSENRYSPFYLIPTWSFGLEINLFVMKLTGETMVNLYNLRDVNAQVGVRIQL